MKLRQRSNTRQRQIYLPDSGQRQKSLSNSGMKQRSLPKSGLRQRSLPDSSLRQRSLSNSGLKQSSLPDSGLKQRSLPDSGLRQRSLPDSGLKVKKTQSRKLGMSEYEERRLKNIEDNQAMLVKIMSDLKGWKPGKEKKAITKTDSPQRKKVSSTPPSKGIVRRNPGRAARPLSYIDETTRRHSTNSINFDSLSASPGRFLVKFSFCRSPSDNMDTDDMKVYSSESEDEEENYYWQPEPEPRMHQTQRFYKDVDEVTDDDIAAVADRSSGKIYNSSVGTTCHQCRQKTIDTKTICRNNDCAGVRGQFCGPCLKNRYGEDARLVLRDNRWICPPCRGICNCSFCRRKAGRGATGILIHLARENGYNDVASYLRSFSKHG